MYAICPGGGGGGVTAIRVQIDENRLSYIECWHVGSHACAPKLTGPIHLWFRNLLAQKEHSNSSKLWMTDIWTFDFINRQAFYTFQQRYSLLFNFTLSLVFINRKSLIFTQTLFCLYFNIHLWLLRQTIVVPWSDMDNKVMNMQTYEIKLFFSLHQDFVRWNKEAFGKKKKKTYRVFELFAAASTSQSKQSG